MPLPVHVSFSQLSTYKYCSKQYELERIRNAPVVPGWFSVAGSAFHELTADLDRGLMEVNPADAWVEYLTNQIAKEESASGVPSTQWRAAGKTKALPDGQRYDWWLIKGREIVDAYVDWAMQMDTPDMIEDDISGFLDADIQIKGTIDRVYGDMIVDIKTSTALPKTGEAQLGVYRAALLARDGEAPSTGAYYMAKDGKLSRPYDLTIWTPEYAAEIFRQFKAGVNAGVFLPSPSFSCNSCPVRTACYTAKGSLSQQFDPLHPGYTGGTV